MKRIKRKNYTKTKKLICDWTDKKKNLVDYRMLKSYVRHGMVVDNFMKKFHLNKLSGWKNIEILIHKKELRLKNILKKTSISYYSILFTANARKMYEIV